MRDEYRMDFDSGRGGYGSILQKEMDVRQQMMTSLADEMSYGGMGGYMMGGGGAGGEGQQLMDADGGGGGEGQPTRFRDEDDDR